MQDSSAIYSQIKQPQFPEQEILKCPRCDSINTKFCYYNNYNLSQPRHYCKSCKRYWTKGGTLRNIPVGGGSRKTTKRSSNNKRSSTSSSSSLATLTTAFDQNSPILDVNGPFSSLLASNGPEFGNLLEGLELNGSNLQLGELPGDQSSNSGLFSGLDAAPDDQSGNKIDEYLTVQNGDDSNCWNGSNGWPDLAIYSPGSSFQ